MKTDLKHEEVVNPTSLDITIPSKNRAHFLAKQHLESKTVEDILREKKEDIEKQNKTVRNMIIRNSRELGAAPHKLNGLSITITTGDKDFKNNLLSLISKMDLKKVTDNGTISEYKLNYIDDILASGNSDKTERLQKLYTPLGKDFLKITFEEEGSISISLEGIVDEKNFNSKTNIIGDIRDEEKRFKEMFSNSESTTKHKQRILKAIINFIYEQNLQASAKIEGISFLYKLNDTAAVTDMISQLSHTKNFIVAENAIEDDFFTVPVSSYKSEIKNPQNFVNVYLEKKGKELVDLETLSQQESCKVLRDAIKKPFKPRAGLSVNIVDGKSYAYAEVNCRPNWNKPIQIDDETLTFLPVFDDNVNYYSFETLMQERYTIALASSGQKAYATPNWCYANQGLVYKLPKDTMKLDEESLYYKKITSTTLLTKAEKAVTLNINDLNFTLADNVDDIADFIDTIPAKLSEDAIADTKFTVAPNQVRAALKYYFQR